MQLYKYRNWDNSFHRSILIHNKVFIPSIAELNDPFDFQLLFDFSLLDAEEKIDAFLDRFEQDYLNSVKGEQVDFLKLKRIKDSYRLCIKNEPLAFSKKYSESHIKGNIQHLGIFCLSQVWDNILMWTHYANNHSGFCIGYNGEKLRQSNFFGKGGSVNYCSEYPLLDPLNFNSDDVETLFQVSNTKFIDWLYEKEYRFEKNWFPATPTQADRFFSFEDDYIDEIVLGLYISKDNENELKEICSRKNIAIYKTQKSNSRFELERTEI